MSTRVIGINLGLTNFGLSLMDGGSCLVVDGVPVTAISEERLSRKRYDGDFVLSLTYCLIANNLTLDDIDIFVFSICCDFVPTVEFIRKVLIQKNIDIPVRKICIIPSHHLSHAYSVYYPSGFEKSLVFIFDNEGNILSGNSMRYYENSLERTSIYLVENNIFTLVGRHHEGPSAHGICSLYDAFTQAIGYRSHQEAGKTMALAPYGTGEFSDIKLFDSEFNPTITDNIGLRSFS